MTNDQLLTAWKTAKDTLDAAKTDEASLRAQVKEAFFPSADEGTSYVGLGNGYRLKHVGKFNYRLDKENDRVNAALDKITKLNNEGAFIVDRLVHWSPALSISEYRGLDEQYREIIDTVLVISPGAPTIELVEPKGKK